MRFTVFIFMVLGLGCSCANSTNEDPAVRAREEHTAACFDLLEQLLSSSDRQRESLFIRLGRDVPVAAVDLLFCVGQGCEVCLDESNSDLCSGCLEGLCPSPSAACRGVEWLEYETSTREPLRYCWELRLCRGRCRQEDERCHSMCYWSSRPGARLAFWRLRATLSGMCAWECGESSSEGCELCARRYQEDRALEQCFEPPPAGR